MKCDIQERKAANLFIYGTIWMTLKSTVVIGVRPKFLHMILFPIFDSLGLVKPDLC